MGNQYACCSGERKPRFLLNNNINNSQSSGEESQEYLLEKLEYFVQNESKITLDKKIQKKRINDILIKELNIQDTIKHDLPQEFKTLVDTVSPIHKNLKNQTLFQFDESFQQQKKILNDLFQEKQSI